MLNKRVLIILFFIIIAMGALSSVSANDATDDVINNVSCDEIKINEEDTNDLSEGDVELTGIETDEILKSTDDGTFKTLYNKINNAQAGSTITLENDYKYASSDEDTIPMITKSLTINGNGHSIDGASESALLRILGKTKVTLNNIIFKNGNASEVIRIDYIDTVNINKCTFENNVGKYFGPLIITDSDTISFSDCTFAENGASAGGAAYVNNTNSISFEGCNFNDNSAQFGGALCLLNYNYAYFDGCSFQNNYGASSGGAIHSENGKGFLTKSSKFSKNSGYHGGSISLINSDECTIYYCDFANNYAINGGAVKLDTLNKANIAACSFSNNHASYGGALHMLSIKNTCSIQACDFMANRVEETDDEKGGVGGAIYSAENQGLHLYSCDFVKNSATTFGGAMALYTTETAIVEYCNFTSNSGVYVGGVITLDSMAAFNLCNFIKNTADKNNDGIGALYTGIYQNTYKNAVIDCTFSGNTELRGFDYGYVTLYTVKLNIKQSGSTCDNKVVTVTLSRLHGDKSVIANEIITFKINGKTYKNIKTNKKGQASLKVNLPAKSYVITAIHEGKGHYNTNSTKTTVVIKKATPKIIASSKNFKVKTKTKKYTITLKNSVGNVMKNTIVKLTVKGKTYSAKTNKKGQATFKITKLTKKGSFPATIKYAGSGYYNAVIKKVTIKVTK